eukprot:TRINITY_DN2199_c7_g1_i1.p1 TRINITY_DN2199_c7_g1~~TRINITY_DN2199_c7_g1_i1.p1  ORF type:complete len:540 (+),score=80.27 TRINITY_DN2199_c7_g1_i1:204-1622(+)
MAKPISDGEHACLSPKSRSATIMAPAKVDEDICFSSPKPARTHDDACSTLLSCSPGYGKENRAPGQTPQCLPTVQEDDGLPGADESQYLPAWVVHSPVPASMIRDDESLEERAQTLHKKGMLSSPTPPGLARPPVKNTFIQFESPLKTIGVRSPPKSVPPYFAPMQSMECPFAEIDEIRKNWAADAELPTFPEADDLKCGSLSHTFDAAYSPEHQMAIEFTPPPPIGQYARSAGLYDQPSSGHASQQPPQHRGTPVRIFDCLSDPPAQVEQQPRQPEPQKATLLRISDYMPEGAQPEAQVVSPSAGTVMPPAPAMTEPNPFAGGDYGGLTAQNAVGHQFQPPPFHQQMMHPSPCVQMQSQLPLHMQHMNEPQFMPQPTMDMGAHLQHQQQQFAAHMQYMPQAMHTGPDRSQMQHMQYMPPFGQMPQAPLFQQYQHTFDQVQPPMIPQQMQQMQQVQPTGSWQPPTSPPKHSA